MKPTFLAAALLALVAQSSSAAIINLHMSNFSFPIWNETKTEVIDQGTGGSLELIIDDAIIDGNPQAEVGHFIGAIIGARCTEGLNNLEFNLDHNSVTEIHTQVDGITSVGFRGNVKDGQGNSALFSLWLEGNFSPSAGDSLAEIDYATRTWSDSIYFTLQGDSVDFVAAVPYDFSVHKVPEPKGAALLLVGLLGLYQSRKKLRATFAGALG